MGFKEAAEALRSVGLAGLTTHLILGGSWVLGSPAMVVAVVVASRLNAPIVAASVLVLGTLQFVLSPKPWPGFARFLRDCGTHGYYASCTMQLPKADIKRSKSMLCYHPHGIECVGYSFNGIHSPEMMRYEATYIIASGIFYLPIFSIICYWLGNVKSATAQTMRDVMGRGKNVALLPGGFEDATVMVKGQERIYLKHRKGFVKFALRYGYAVYPVYTFGESDTFATFTKFPGFRLWLNQYKIPAVLAWGNPWLPFLPRPEARLHTAFGEPIEFPKIESPTDADVDLWHTKYVTELVNLFETHKAQAGYGDRTLMVL
ncbi:hypothetical protein CTAYLR_005058 [Chrysophaeum taylorii]|uniref:Acyltransferase n=1 Tax=Chrysophaeum taylorii TaxID=2483200 RepID=A0AAD7U9S3_9STRA|nr:hypothetical protein CTAYLR_005058 [Chrysophaeum taylorii]